MSPDPCTHCPEPGDLRFAGSPWCADCLRALLTPTPDELRVPRREDPEEPAPA